MCVKCFMTVRFGGEPPFKENFWGAEGHSACTVIADHMGIWFMFAHEHVTVYPRCRGDAP
jgi:hypothetical protein